MGVSFRSEHFLLSSSQAIPNKIDAHIHKYYEFLYFYSGNASYITNDNIYKLNSGDVTFTKPNEMHTISFSDNSLYCRTFIQLSSHLLAGIPHNLVKNILNKKSGINDIITAENANKYNLKSFFEKGAALLENPTEKNMFFAKLLFNEFAVCVNDALGNTTNTLSDNENSLVCQIKEYIDKSFTKNLSLDAIAKIFFTNKYHVCHIFKQETGITVSDYIALKRINMIKKKINENLTINESYRLCGFNDYSTFYRTVKKYTGLKPSDFYGL